MTIFPNKMKYQKRMYTLDRAKTEADTDGWRYYVRDDGKEVRFRGVEVRIKKNGIWEQ